MTGRSSLRPWHIIQRLTFDRNFSQFGLAMLPTTYYQFAMTPTETRASAALFALPKTVAIRTLHLGAELELLDMTGE